jgi:hypothetical protein
MVIDLRPSGVWGKQRHLTHLGERKLAEDNQKEHQPGRGQNPHLQTAQACRTGAWGRPSRSLQFQEVQGPILQ